MDKQAAPTGDLMKEGRIARMLNSGVDYSDLQAILRTSPTDLEWSRLWETFGQVHEDVGDDALKEGRTRSAGEAFVRAAVYFHTGQSGNISDLAERARLQERQQAAYRKGAAHLHHPAVQLMVPFRNIEFPGNLRRPAGSANAPCVVLLAGADSTKEEFYTLENTFLDRGVATFSFDGPGQSLTRNKLPYLANVEESISAVLDVIERQPGIDATRFGIWGRSFGGYAAPRAAALDQRLKACVSVGGFYDMHAWWDNFHPMARKHIIKSIGAQTPEEAVELAKAFTLSGLLSKLRCPFLVIHSHLDAVCSYRDGERMAREAAGQTDLKIFPDGDHACDNISYKVRPMTADWVARKLGVLAV